jgi:opacity protein-like surface antigen
VALPHLIERLEMKNTKHALATLLAVLAAGTVSAQSLSKNSGYYGEVGYSAIKFDDGDTSTTPKLARLIIGTNINANLDAEAAIALTASKGDVNDSNENGKLSAKQFGLYAKPKIEIAKDTELFGRIGISHTSWKSNNSVSENSDSFTKLAYGIGVQTQFTKDVYGQIDYMNLGKKEGVSAKGITLSIGTRF